MGHCLLGGSVPSPVNRNHYMRNTQSRRSRTKNGDAHTVRLHHRVSHYPGASPIRIHLRCAIVSAHLPLEINPERALRTHVADLITSLGHYGTNRRHTLLDACLLFDAPHGHPSCQLHLGAS
jgi:hypothetical protein